MYSYRCGKMESYAHKVLMPNITCNVYIHWSIIINDTVEWISYIQLLKSTIVHGTAKVHIFLDVMIFLMSSGSSNYLKC